MVAFTFTAPTSTSEPLASWNSRIANPFPCGSTPDGDSSTTSKAPAFARCISIIEPAGGELHAAASMPTTARTIHVARFIDLFSTDSLARAERPVVQHRQQNQRQ